MDIIKEFPKRIQNNFTLFTLSGFLFGVAMFLVGTFLPATQWTWLTPQLAGFFTIAGITLVVISFIIFIVAFIKTSPDKANPSIGILIGLKKLIWKLYKLEQNEVIKAGKKGLTNQKLDEIVKQVRRDLNIKVKNISSPLTEDETEQIASRITKKYNKKESISKKGLRLMFTLGYSLDKCDVGVKSLIGSDQEYDLNLDKLNEKQLSINKQKNIAKIREISYSLNSTLLAVYYLYPTKGKEVAPDFHIQLDLFKEAVNNEMQYHLKKI